MGIVLEARNVDASGKRNLLRDLHKTGTSLTFSCCVVCYRLCGFDEKLRPYFIIYMDTANRLVSVGLTELMNPANFVSFLSGLSTTKARYFSSLSSFVP